MTAPAMALTELAEAAPGLIGTRGQATITGLADDSRAVQPGDLFFCLPGANHDGHDFAAQAHERGAAALVVERPLGLACPEFETASVRRAVGPVSAAFYGQPSRSMTMVGVTGTNGKTTVASLLASILEAAGCRTETIGTLTGTLTTPAPVCLQRRLAEWRSTGVEAVVMEVSSHALDQHRVDGICFDAAVFTNLTQDHLDYHGTMEHYFAAKQRLFTPELAARAVVNLADPQGRQLADNPCIPTVGYDPQHISWSIDGPAMALRWRGEHLRLPLVGRFNAANALAAAETALLLGVGVAEITTGLESVPPVPGRFEMVETGRPFTVIVDFAHTPDGLAQVLDTARELVADGAHLRVVFGCGGDRDPDKRPEMGRVAAELADQVVVTSDNPRSEDPEAIIADVLAGAPPVASHLATEPDRREAIAQCLADAAEGDVVVVAGKGHETTQTVGDEVIPFDDRAVVRELSTGKAPVR